MMFRKRDNLDERQLLLRGNIYGHVFFLLMLLTVGNAALVQQGIQWAPGQWSYLLLALLCIVWCHVEMIHCGVYPMGEKRHKLLYLTCGAVGIIGAVAVIWEMVALREPFVSRGALTESSCAIFVMAGFAFTGVFYCYKEAKRRGELED